MEGDNSKKCRLCLAEAEVMCPIFNSNSKNNPDSVALPQRIMSFAQIKVAENDGLPSSICSHCLAQVNKSYQFKLQCEQSDATLRPNLKSVKEPDFITYLLDPDQEYDCYFLVGNKQYEEPEKVGVVKKMLLAHSIVLRTELKGSKMAEKGVVCVEDLYPDTFKNLLKYVYGCDNIPGLSFDEADNLLYAAEKYFMDKLKAKLAGHLIPLLNTDNIFRLFQNPACFKSLELDAAITKILQSETDRILANPLLVDISSDVLTKILEQDVLKAPEVELFKSAVKWAKHKSGSEDGKVLRNQLQQHTKHIRVHTLKLEEFVKDVIPTGLLTDKEVVQSLALYRTEEEKSPVLENFSDKIQERSMILERKKPIIAKTNRCEEIDESLSTVKLDFSPINHSDDCADKFSLRILTKSFNIELLSFGAYKKDLALVPIDVTYPCTGRVIITRITDYENATSSETPVTVMFSQQIAYNTDFEVPIINRGENATLLSNNLYDIQVVFDSPVRLGRTNIYAELEMNHAHLSYKHLGKPWLVPRTLLYRLA